MSLQGDVEVTLRHVQSGDAAALAQLMCELGYETTKSDMQMRVARIATDERYRTFVAVRDGKVCGMIGTFAYYSFGHNNPCGRIVALVVRKDSRRLAFGGGWSWRWKKTLSDEASSASPWIHGLREKTRTRFMSARLRTKRVAICEATCSDQLMDPDVARLQCPCDYGRSVIGIQNARSAERFVFKKSKSSSCL